MFYYTINARFPEGAKDETLDSLISMSEIRRGDRLWTSSVQYCEGTETCLFVAKLDEGETIAVGISETQLMPGESEEYEFFKPLEDAWRSDNAYIAERGKLVCVYDDTYGGPYDETGINKIASRIIGEEVYGPAAIFSRKEDNWIAYYDSEKNYTSLSVEALNEILKVLKEKD